LGSELLYRDREATLEIAQAGRPWSFDADGAMLRLVSETYRIRLAHLFDPYLAVHTSDIDPLPHQITAVYGEMLNRQPLRFLLEVLAYNSLIVDWVHIERRAATLTPASVIQGTILE